METEESVSVSQPLELSWLGRKQREEVLWQKRDGDTSQGQGADHPREILSFCLVILSGYKYIIIFAQGHKELCTDSV